MEFKKENIEKLNSEWPLPKNKKNIVIIGAGGIVHDAHLPAYKKAGFNVIGIFDPLNEKAKALAKDYDIPQVFNDINQALETKDVVFDIAVPPSELSEVVELIPENSICQLQKPMGTSLKEALEIQKKCVEKKLIASVNFQLKFSPMMLAVSDAIEKGMLGELLELEVHLSTHTPWELWPFLKDLERVEIPLHSIHYLDWIRSVLGSPRGVYSRSVKHKKVKDLADSRSSIILDYGDDIRCCLSINHNHYFGPKHSDAYIRLEGDKGAAFIYLGLLLNYPKGEPERVEIITEGLDWIDVPIKGNWFPDAFIGTMSNLQRYVFGEDKVLLHSVESALGTMAIVEACMISNQSGVTQLPKF
jgi:predicted dehydrogenase